MDPCTLTVIPVHIYDSPKDADRTIHIRGHQQTNGAPVAWLVMLPNPLDELWYVK
jgi:hypothetical protein